VADLPDSSICEAQTVVGRCCVLQPEFHPVKYTASKTKAGAEKPAILRKMPQKTGINGFFKQMLSLSIVFNFDWKQVTLVLRISGIW
jgi:hypothetical protein